MRTLQHATLSASLKWAIFTQRRRVAELKPFAHDCAKLHAAALVALVSIAQGTPQPETTRRPSWLRLARHASRFYGFSVLLRDRRGPNIRAKACSLRACGPQGRLSLPAIHLSLPAMHPSRRGFAQPSWSWISLGFRAQRAQCPDCTASTPNQAARVGDTAATM